jgi:AraC-like DNA-binding protein
VQLSLVAPLSDAPPARVVTQPTPVRLRTIDRPEFGLSLGSAVCEARPSDAYVLAVPLDRGGRPVGPATMANPGDSTRPGPTGRTLFVRIGRDVLVDELTVMLGRPADAPVRFEDTVDLFESATGIGVLLEQLVQGLTGDPDALMAHPHVLLRQIRTLAAALLLSQPHSFTNPLVLGQSPPRPRTLRRALQFMTENVSEPLTLTDLAEAAGCSPRTLNSAFRDYLAVTPMTYLRNLRLERVREELLGADDPIGAIAYRWGFTHLGRFAGVYSRRFGELPSQTASRGQA